ncbi:(Fe-S)-binding protein, partial [Thermodesulfobacteriota bacterium]
TVRDFTWKELLEAQACTACNRCEEHCPAAISGKPLSPLKVIQTIKNQMDDANRKSSKTDGPFAPYLENDISLEAIWSCTTCMACVEHCPVFVEPIHKIIDMRRFLVMGKGMAPDETRPMMRNLQIYGDVQGRGASHRSDWALTPGGPRRFEDVPEAELLLWVGCQGAFHPRYQRVLRSMVEILDAAGIRFGVLDKKECCCGDPARRLGAEDLFLELAQKNIDHFNQCNVREIVTLCPHCFNTLKNEYPLLTSDLPGKLGADFEVRHATEFVMRLMEQKRIIPKYPITKTATIHDPCYLGRMNHMYNPLREIVKSVPGLEISEMKQSRENGFCCGGGGGRMWLHETSGRRMNLIRAEEIRETGVDILGTACPYCLTMLEDGIKSLEIEKPPKVWDVIEIVADSLGVRKL